MAPRPRLLHPSARWKNRTGVSLVLTITTHRFVFLREHPNDDNDNTGETTTTTTTTPPSTTDARFVHLSNVKKAEGAGGPTLRNPNASYKIVLQTQTYDELVLVFPNHRSWGSGGSARDDRDTSLKELTKALERRRWEVATRMKEQQAMRTDEQAYLKNKVGLDRILAKNEMRHRENAKLAEQALSGDSETLLQEAAGLLKVIQKYTVLVQKFEGNNNGGSSNNDDDAEAARKLKGLLSDMGMTSALSQSKMAGNRQKNRAFGRMPGRSSEERSRLREYHELTARQVADFLVPRLKGSSKNKTTTTSSSSSSRSHHGGMMSLTDVYCLFNRARGSNLISPEDLREACSLLGTELKVGLTMRTFPSGIVVLQLDDLALSPTNYEARRALIDLCSPARGRTALEASHVLGLSPLLASEQLEEAERLGWLCRDATVSTVRFYPNKFAMSF